ncbi:MAG: Ku protein, partial [Xanthobacteraceae bacterium]
TWSEGTMRFLAQFLLCRWAVVPRHEIDELYLNNPYYIAPDGEVGQQAFAVIREAIRKEGMVAIGKVVFTSREHIIALEPRGKGLLGVTLRYPYEVRNEVDYFDDIPDEKIPKDMLDLASHIVKTKGGTLNRASLNTSTKMRSRSCSKRSRRASQSSGQSNPSRQTWSISWMRFGAASRRAVRLHQARRMAARQLLAVHLKKPNIQSGKRRGVPDELSCRKTALNDAQHRSRSSRWRYRGTQNDNGASELDEPFSDGEQSSLIRGGRGSAG